MSQPKSGALRTLHSPGSVCGPSQKSSANERLIDWIRDRLLSEKRPAELALEHSYSDGSCSTIQLETVNYECESLEAEAHRIAEEFGSQADSHVAGFGRTQTYLVVAYSEDRRILAQHRFRLKPDDDLMGGDSEPATPNGALAQMMRLSEGFARYNIAVIQSMVGTLAKACDTAHNRIAQLEAQRIADFDAREKLMGMQHERDLERIDQEAREARKDRTLESALQSLKPILPDIAAQIFPGVKANLDARAKIKMFLETLTDDQQSKIGEILTPAQAAQLIGMLGETVEEPSKETE